MAAIFNRDSIESQLAVGKENLGFNELLMAVEDIKISIASASKKIEQQRSIPADIISKLREIGIFGMCFPKDWGGKQLTSWEQLLVIESLARADASTAWCAMIGCDSGIYSGYLQDNVSRQLFKTADKIMAGWIHPQGSAEIVDGGYRVNGHWRFASGSRHSDFIAAGCYLTRNGEIVIEEQKPVWRVMLSTPSDYHFDDTWFTTGLNGSCSQDYNTKNLFIPSEHSFSFYRPYRHGPLHDAPDAILRKMPGVPLGLARACLDYIYAIAEKRVDRVCNTNWISSSRVQTAIAKAEAALFSARSAVEVSLKNLWSALENQAPAYDILYWRVQSSLSRRLAFQNARSVISEIYDIQAGASIYSFETPIDRAFRDINTICQHAVAQEKILQICGDILMGNNADDYFI